ncbi:hypothetical protein CHLRE_17g702300v5 [Chlamydomonas reinhardtii]|uniref:Uncharacterized protein n=1 Tax=Chlamydomonas reinhardtii TaxID=3055 RepID=A0A2K3CP25_CHLRE|nr:uncharacterized protein CHLRE_17g702300v5 [Chlamydomonas reinhardtii]PNW70018.1 hypothetical protein CHLRE_17g702300v5 [Chlamydomonas reinhardtii]
MRRTLFLGSALLLAYCLLLAASQGDGVLGEECLAEDGTCPAPSLRKSSSNATSMLSQALGDEGAAWLAHVWPVVQPAGISGIVGYATGLLVRRVVQMVVLATAILITAVQGLAYLGWVTEVMGGGSGGGMGAEQLLALLADRVTAVASQGLPSVAGFTTGLTLAFMPGLQII